jgi:hypothetical protein
MQDCGYELRRIYLLGTWVNRASESALGFLGQLHGGLGSNRQENAVGRRLHGERHPLHSSPVAG